MEVGRGRWVDGGVEREMGRWRCREGGRNGAWEVGRHGLGEGEQERGQRYVDRDYFTGII